MMSEFDRLNPTRPWFAGPSFSWPAWVGDFSRRTVSEVLSCKPCPKCIGTRSGWERNEKNAFAVLQAKSGTWLWKCRKFAPKHNINKCRWFERFCTSFLLDIIPWKTKKYPSYVLFPAEVDNGRHGRSSRSLSTSWPVFNKSLSKINAETYWTSD